MEVLTLIGSDEHKQRYLRPLLDGTIRSAFAMPEPGVASSDAISDRRAADGAGCGRWRRAGREDCGDAGRPVRPASPSRPTDNVSRAPCADAAAMAQAQQGADVKLLIYPHADDHRKIAARIQAPRLQRA